MIIETNSRASDPIISVRDLTIEFSVPGGVLRAVDGVSYDVYPGDVLGVVGESGSGKSVSVMSMLGLLPSPPARIVAGSVMFEGRDLLKLSKRQLRSIRGSRIAMVFQDPMTALNPVFKIGSQLAEALRVHNPEIERAEIRRRGVEILDMVGIPDPAVRYNQYPHQFSGGMRQRAMIAMAIANKPALLIADEPTTALDVTIQAQVLDVLRTVQKETGAASILITHDLGLVAEMANRLLVMYAGRVAETGSIRRIFNEPKHPYSVGLLSSIPRLDADMNRLVPIEGQPPNMVDPPPGCRFHPRCALRNGREVCVAQTPELIAVEEDHSSACHFVEEVGYLVEQVNREMGVSITTEEDSVTVEKVEHASGFDRPDTGDVILEVKDLKKYFVQRTGLFEKTALKAVDGVNLTLRAGQTVGLVGESGSGKTTVGRTIVRLYRPSGGQILFRGRDISQAPANELLDVRRHIQMVFQDPFASLNPRMKVRDIVAEPLMTHGMWDRDGGARRVSELLDMVGLSMRYAGRYPHEFSGGQRQRIGIARALALHPQVLILDEPVSALDVSIQAQIVNLLQELQDELNLAYLFIAHDLSVVRHIADQVAVMYLGQIVEDGPKKDVFRRAAHPYTQALLSSVPIPDPDSAQRSRRIVLEGDLPNPADPPSGCRFRTRCPIATDRCAVDPPALITHPDVSHPVACHYAEPKDMLT